MNIRLAGTFHVFQLTVLKLFIIFNIIITFFFLSSLNHRLQDVSPTHPSVCLISYNIRRDCSLQQTLYYVVSQTGTRVLLVPKENGDFSFQISSKNMHEITNLRDLHTNKNI